MRLTGLCLAVLSLSFIEAQTSPPTSPPPTTPTGGSSPSGEGCCLRKVVSGTGNMDGTYNYVKTFDGEKNENCYDGCIYTREGRAGEEYCFKWVDSGAANINDECEAPTGTPPMTESSLPPASGSSEETTPPAQSQPPSSSGSPGPTELGSTPGESSGSGAPTGTTPPSPGSSEPGSPGPTEPGSTGETSPGTGPAATGNSTLPPPSSGETSLAPLSGSSTVPTSAGSTLSPEATISAANSVITKANEAHAVATENANTASEASTAVDDIQASLSARIKRQSASTTVGPVSDCTDFGSR